MNLQCEKISEANLRLLLQVEPKDRALSTSEDPLQYLPNSKAEPSIRSRPLSDLYPFHSHADKSAAPYLLSGCGAQVQPMTAGPDENRLNGLNSSAWTNPIIGQPEGKPYSSRIMKLFSNSKKGPFPAQNQTADSSSSTHSGGSNGGPQSWSGLSGLGVVDSFKKLRSSVLQGIQSRGSINNEGDVSSSSQDTVGLEETSDQLKFTEGYSGSNGTFPSQNLALTSQCESDIEDYYDDDDGENNEGDGFTRNTRFSRSIRRAYGAGRISLFDVENGRAAGLSASTTDGQKPDETSEVNSQSEKMNENANVKVIGRLSKSAENLHIFKVPFRRKAPPQGPSPTEEDPQGSSNSNRTSSIQRTASASSVDLQGHASRRRSPVKTKGPMLKLVGSMTDLTVRRRRSPSPSPTSPSLMSPLSRLHDDYSRRVPCFATSERQRRPSPVRARVLSVGHTPLVHPQPECDDNQQQHQVLISSSTEGPPETAELTSPDNAAFESLPLTSTSTADGDSPPLQAEPLQQQELTEVTMPPNKVSRRCSLQEMMRKVGCLYAARLFDDNSQKLRYSLALKYVHSITMVAPF